MKLLLCYIVIFSMLIVITQTLPFAWIGNLGISKNYVTELMGILHYLTMLCYVAKVKQQIFSGQVIGKLGI